MKNINKNEKLKSIILQLHLIQTSGFIMAKLFVILAIVFCARFLYNKKQEYKKQLLVYKYNHELKNITGIDYLQYSTNTTYEPPIVTQMNVFKELTLAFGIAISIMMGIFTCCLAVIAFI